MASVTEDIVIVGAGECGARAAMALREQGARGTITLVGDESLEPYERPPLSKAALTDDREPSPVTVCDRARFAHLDIAFERGVAATMLDRTAHDLVLADGRRLHYDKALIATGARARVLPVAGGHSILTLRTFTESVALRSRMTPGARVGVIGAGFIGLELAASAVTRGCQVTVVEIAASVMARVVPAEIAAIVEARHRDAGVDLRLGTGVEHVEHVDRPRPAQRLVLDDGTTVDCDVIVAGVGAVADSAVAAASGLTIDNGVRVDRYLRTDDPDIHAAGDCCSFPHPLYDDRRIRLEAWRNALDQAAVVARNLLGADEAFAAVPWFWTDQYELGLHIAGLPDAAVTNVVRVRADGATLLFGLGADGRLVAASGVAQGTAIAKDIRIAEMLIAQRTLPDPSALTNPAVTLKSLLV